MTDDQKWLLSQEIFGGHTFDRFEGYGMHRCAKAVRAVMEHEDFCDVLCAAVDAERSALVAASDMLASTGSSMETFRLATFSATRRFAQLVEGSIVAGFQALEYFNKLPKRTSAAHKKHYSNIAALATKLADALDKTPSLYANFEQRDLLEVAAQAEEAAVDAPLSRPAAKCADRTYVAKKVTLWMYRVSGSYRHAAAASLVNVLFPAYEPIDASYMQSLARTIKSEE